MKKILILFAIILFIPFAHGITKAREFLPNHCLFLNQSVFNGNYVEVDCFSETGTSYCSNLFDKKAGEGGATQWTTPQDEAHDINSELKPSVLYTYNTERWDIKYLDVYFENSYVNVNLPSATRPYLYTISFYYDNSWHDLIGTNSLSNVYNCSYGGDTEKLILTYKPECQRFELNIFDVERIMVNVSETYNITGDTDNMIFPEIAGCGAPAQYCTFPTIFCETFNYPSPMEDNGWVVYDESFKANHTFSPIDDELLLNESTYVLPYHETETFDTNYTTTEKTTVTKSYNSPVFSSEFDLFIYNTTNISDYAYDCLGYSAFDVAGQSVYTIYFCSNESVYYYDKNEIYQTLCNSCLTFNQWNKVKINTYFQPNDYYDFNSTVTANHIKFYINSAYKDSISFLDNSSYNIQKYEFIKNYDSKAIIDNYYVMVGTDRSVDTSKFYYKQEYTKPIYDELDEGEGSGDIASELENFWDNVGIKSTASRITVALFFMFLLGLIIIGVQLKSATGVRATPIIIIEFLFMVLLVYIKLLPIWIPIVLTLLSAGIATYVFKSATN